MSYNNNAISSDDPKAVEKLTEKLNKCEKEQEFMKKVRYIFGRIKNMNFKNMSKTIDKIHTLSGKSKVFIFFDMMICALRY